ncbi:MAG: methyltransferase domain-containing protein [Pseudomonadales bacterium]|nr:methyltransferase domain-containing protein [Pseudomonadales bacterium]
MQDKNFDDLFDRFAANIYQSLKGQIRLAVIRQDLQEFVPEIATANSLRVLDAGGGLGVLTAELALRGHHLVYCDISAKMLNAARQQAEALALAHPVELFHEPIQTLLKRDQNFQLILFHAVLEWLSEPQKVLDQMIESMEVGAKLSLLFYNRQSIIFKNLLRGNFFKATADSFRGDKGSLTPSHPLDPDDVRRWLSHHNVNILCASGVRVFNDYGEKARLQHRTDDQIIETELRFSRQQPFRELGRYYHLVIAKN